MRLQQQLVRRHALRAADDLAVTLGREHVHAQRQFRPLRIRLHVKRLHLRGIAVHHHRPVELRRDISLVRRAEIAAPLELVLQRALGVAFLQHLHRFVVGDARKRRVDLFQLGDVAADDLQLGAALLQAALHDEGDEALRPAPSGRRAWRRRLPARPSRTRSGGGGSSISRRGRSGRSEYTLPSAIAVASM